MHETMPSLRPGRVLASAIVAMSFATSGVVTSCSGASPSTGGLEPTNPCGPGTVSVKGECIVAPTDASSQVDGVAPSDASDDGTFNSFGDGGASPADSDARDGAIDAPESIVPDPCPNPDSGPALKYDCSGRCVPDGSLMGAEACIGKSLVCIGLNGIPGKVDVSEGAVVVTPDHSFADCAGCPADAGVVTAGLFLSLDALYSATFVVRVGAPWNITNLSTGSYRGPYVECPILDPDTTSMGCQVVLGADVISVWTDDPSPVARNVTISPGSSCP